MSIHIAIMTAPRNRLLYDFASTTANDRLELLLKVYACIQLFQS